MIRGSSALVTVPNVGVPTVKPSPDAPACNEGSEMPGRMLLVTLKASARNSSVPISRMRNSRETAVSNCQNAAPGMFIRPIGLSVPIAGVANAAGLIQQLGAGPGFAQRGFCEIWTGRWIPAAAVVVE